MANAPCLLPPHPPPPQVKDYSYSSGVFSSGTGHFTQLVWVNSTGLGCAAQVCSSFNLLVCKYWPPGNYQGEFKTNVLRP
jgi:hypothetical protein